MTDAVKQLRDHLAYVADLGGLSGLASWDAQVNLPPGAAQSRAHQMAAITRALREAFDSPRVDELLAQAGRDDALKGDNVTARMIDQARADLAYVRLVPPELAQETARAASAAHDAWKTAKKNNDFASYLPHLERRFELARRTADARGYDEHPYDALVGGYEAGVTTSAIREMFAALRAEIVPLVQAVSARSAGDETLVLQRGFDVGTQRSFALMVSELLGYDLRHGRLDEVMHPFCGGTGADDVRITSRFQHDNLRPGLISTWHEAGHGMHTQGVRREYLRSPLERWWPFGVRALGLAESQSKIWDGPVARGLPFWRYWFPKLQGVFVRQLADVSVEEFHRALNAVRPGLIRTEADQLTYDLHIMLRTELEIALVEGSVRARELPEAWNAKMQEYLGLTPPDDARGVLQDVHWSSSTGYFPTYTLGNVMSVQFYDAADRDLGGLDAQFERGEFGPLREWLREHVHQHGRAMTSTEILRGVTGGGLDARPYVSFLKRKFGVLYGLDVQGTSAD